MKFSEAVKVCFSKYCCFSGRAQRAEYWYWYLFVLTFTSVFYFVASFIAAMICDEYNSIPTIITTIVGIGLLLPSLSVCIRRLHDVGKSGWYLFMGIIPIVGIVFLIVQYCLDSQPEENRYGICPKK